jgi:plastocyanin
MNLSIVRKTVLLSLLVFWQAQASAITRVQVVDSAGAPVPDAVIYLDGIDSGFAVPDSSVVVDQIDKQFVPRITVVQTGTRIEFPNRDAVSHHVYSFANPNSFELPLYKGAAKPSVRFDHAGLVTLGCNIHDSMLGYILVVDSPYYAVTDHNGVTEILWAEKITEDASVRVWSPALANGKVLIAARGTADPVYRDIAFLLAVDATQAEVGPDVDSSLSWDEY